MRRSLVGEMLWLPEEVAALKKREDFGMGTLRRIRREGTKERKADALDQACGMPPGGVPLVLYDENNNTFLVKFQARRSDFLEKIGQAWRDYAIHPQFSGRPARMAIEVPVYNHDGKMEIILCSGGAGWLIRSEVKTQEAANALWENVVKMWGRIEGRQRQ